MSHLRFGLVGHPLEHSFSRNFFSQKFEKEGLDCSFSTSTPSVLKNGMILS